MKLVSILNEKLIICGLDGNTREELYGKLLAHVLKETGLKGDASALLSGIIEREDAFKIPYEGIALPHVRTDTSPDLTIAIGIIKQAVKLKRDDFAPSQIIIMSLIGPSASDLYLKSLSAFSRYLIRLENRQKLINCAKPSDVISQLEKDHVQLKNEITAEDIMQANYPVIYQDRPISAALDIFTRENVDRLPVLDNDGNLLGELEAAEIIRQHIPSYIFMMDNLKFLTSFEPFDNIFKEEQKLTVKTFMQKPQEVIPPDTPLIQLTISLVKQRIACLYVVDPTGKLLGVVGMQQLIHKVLRA